MAIDLSFFNYPTQYGSKSGKTHTSRLPSHHGKQHGSSLKESQVLKSSRPKDGKPRSTGKPLRKVNLGNLYDVQEKGSQHPLTRHASQVLSESKAVPNDAAGCLNQEQLTKILTSLAIEDSKTGKLNEPLMSGDLPFVGLKTPGQGSTGN